MYQFDHIQLRTFIESCAQVGVATFLREQAPAKDEMTQREAFAEFGESRVRAWLKDGAIQAERRGTCRNSPKILSRTKLYALLTAEQAHRAHLRSITPIR